MIRPLFALLASLIVLGDRTASGYGNAGHEIVGTVAERLIQGTPAEAKVRALLKPNETLAKAATWADRAKFPDQYLSPEMKEFVANNPDHHQFHYCDVPFQEKRYRAGGTGTNPADIVQMMSLCIRILQDPDPAPKNPRHFSKRVALLLLAHLAGDIHQPLHVGCSYVDAKDKFVNPEKGGKGEEDRGGNNFNLRGKTSLHGFWDTPAVKLAKDKAHGQDYVTYLLTQQPPKPEWKSSGPPATWPQQWATDTLQLSSQALHGIKLSNRHTVPADEKHPPHTEWTVTLPPGYEEQAANVVEMELAKGGYRFAELLKAIWP